MQSAQSPDLPPAAPTPPALPGRPIALTPSGPIALPRTAEELSGLRERRSELSNQLSSTEERRSELLQELGRQTEPAARAGIEQRISLLDKRILQIETDLAATGQALSNAPPAILAQTEQLERQLSNRVPEEEAIGVAFATFFLGVFGTLLVRWLVGLRRRRRGGAPTVAAAPDPRIDQLAHAVDAIAMEVERIGEGQRFVTQLLAEQREGARAQLR